MFENFKNTVDRLKDALKKIKTHELDIKEKTSFDKTLFSFKEKRRSYYKNVVERCLISLEKFKLDKLALYDQNNEPQVIELRRLIKNLKYLYNGDNLNELENNINQISNLIGNLRLPERENLKIDYGSIPSDIKDDVIADLKEVEKCFNAECYRSAVIICGRVLETVLHRKYYEVTGLDLLEKSPGIGLGKLIAKLTDKNVRFDPGITQQIHLVNQLRIFSVHKKKELFYPSRGQTQAVILFTLDVISKLFD